MNKAPEIIAKSKVVERAAFEELFHMHYKNLVLYAKKFVMDTEVARDIVQDVYIYLWEKRDKLRIERSVKSYMFRATKNGCLNYLKREEHKEDYIKQFLISINETQSDRNLDVHDQVLENDLLQKIEEAIEALPLQCRTIFRKSRFRGLKNKEIAEEHSISCRTVETQIYRAIKALRENLKPYFSQLACLTAFLINF